MRRPIIFPLNSFSFVLWICRFAFIDGSSRCWCHLCTANPQNFRRGRKFRALWVFRPPSSIIYPLGCGVSRAVPVAPWLTGKWESVQQRLLAIRPGRGVQASQPHVFAWKIRLECLPARCFTAARKCRGWYKSRPVCSCTFGEQRCTGGSLCFFLVCVRLEVPASNTRLSILTPVFEFVSLGA